ESELWQFAAGRTRVSSSGRIFPFFGCRGGAGTTTLAVHAAATLAQLGPRGAVVVDLDVQLGDVLCALNLEPQDTLVDVMEEIQRLEPAALRRRLAMHPSGVYALSQASNLSQLDALHADGIYNLLTMLARQFDFVVVDGVRDFGDHALVALDLASRIVLVTTADIPAVRSTARSLEIFRQLGY